MPSRRSESPYLRATGAEDTHLVAGGYEAGASHEQERGLFVARRDESGADVWKHSVPCSQAAAVLGLEVGAQGSSWMTGWYSGSLGTLEARGRSEMHLTAFAADGTVRWREAARRVRSPPAGRWSSS